MKIEEENREDFGEGFSLEKGDKLNRDQRRKLKKKKIVKVSFDVKKPDLIERVFWIVSGYFEFGGINIISGKGGSGKTTFCLKLVQLNYEKKEFWPGGPKGDGRKSAIICRERSRSDIYGTLMAHCGGGDGAKDSRDYIDYLEKVKIGDEEYNIDDVWDKPKLLNEFMKGLMKMNYAFVIIDPIYQVEMEGQNKNEKVRKKLNQIIPHLEGKRTALLGTAHPRKEKKDISEVDKVRGASEWTNYALNVSTIRELKGDKGYILQREKSNHCNDNMRGGIKYKIINVKIDDKYMEKEVDPERQDDSYGGIGVFSYVDKTKNRIRFMCVSDKDEVEESFTDGIQRALDIFKEEKRGLLVDDLRNYCVVDEDTKFMSHNNWRSKGKVKWRWEQFGYKVVRRSTGNKGGKDMLVKLDDRERDFHSLIEKGEF